MTRYALILAGVLLAAPAWGQDPLQKYIHNDDRYCCPHDNCFPVKARYGIERGVEGYRVPGKDNFFPMWRIHRWPFKATYACWYPKEPTKVKCLYMPGSDG